MRLEDIIFCNLVYNEDFSRKSLPYIKEDYFADPNDKILFGLIDNFVKTYNKLPTKQTLSVDLENIEKSISDDQFSTLSKSIDAIKEPDNDIEWLLNTTEKFCQEKAVYNAIMQSIKIIDGKEPNLSKGALPDILSDALSVSFDTHIGHDLLEDTDERFEFYHKKEIKVPFDLDYFNKITKGGVPKKTLNIALAGTGVGKSLFMCHCAASNLLRGNNVLYITMEMAEEKIAERIDANLLDTTIDELMLLPKDTYDKRIDKVKNTTAGKLIIKEYPTAGAGSSNFRYLLNELKQKRGFIPDVIYIDYLNICTSSRIRVGASVNSYTYVKAIAEELRGLAVEFEVPIFSATQTTRSGFSSSDIGLEDTSESFGLPATADFMFALISTEELQELGQMMVKQLKNRYSDPTTNKRFVIGVDRAKMKLYDVEQRAQNDIVDEGPLMDKSPLGKKLNSERKDFSEFF
jgi:archaellum biogenesis ATPase FlaH